MGQRRKNPLDSNRRKTTKIVTRVRRSPEKVRVGKRGRSKKIRERKTVVRRNREIVIGGKRGSQETVIEGKRRSQEIITGG